MKLLVSIMLVLIWTTLAFAQDRSGEVLQQLERKELILEKMPEEPPLIEKEEKPETEFKDGEKILVREFKVQGAALLDAAAINTILAPYKDKELALIQITQAADLITAAYRQKGYLAAYAYIPAQDIKDGIVIIQVIEAKTGGITITGNKNYSTQFILGHLEKTKQEPSIKEQTLERALMLLNDYPSLNVNASLKPGKEPGTTDIAINAADSYPISASISYDNFGTRTLSKHRMSIVIDKGNTITDGDDIRLIGVTGLDEIDLNKLSYGRIDYIFPIDYNGTRAGIYYANSLYEAGENLTPLKIDGKANTAGIHITHPAIKTAYTTLSLKLAFDYKDVYDYMLDSLRSRDKIREISLGITYDGIDRLYQSARNIFNLNYTRGIGDMLGGSDKNDTNTSRLHADGDFNKFTLDAVRIQKLTSSGYNLLIIKGAGQYSSDPLFVAEQFTIGGAGSVRGFKPSTYSGDSGYNITAELHLSPIFADTTIFNQKIGDTIKLALFADHGGVYKNNVQPGENKDDYLTSIGAGIRLYAGKHLSIRFDYAVPDINGNFNSRNSETYVQAVFSF